MRFHLATLADFDYWQRFREELYDDLDPAYSEAEIHRITNDPNMASYLIFEDETDNLMGMLELSLRNIMDGCASSPVANIDGLYVVEQFQNQGIGPKIIAFSKQWALEQGCTELTVDTELDNHRAQQFYLKNGFKETFRIVQYKMELD